MSRNSVMTKRGWRDQRGTLKADAYTAQRTMELPVIHPFARGAGTSNGIQWSTEYTQSATTGVDQEVERVVVDWGIEGEVIELEFGLTGGFSAASTATADLKYQWQARSVGDEGKAWTALCAQVSKDNINTTVVEETYSGYFGVSTSKNPITQLPSQDLLTVPFEARLVIQSNEASQAQGKTKNSSYFKAKIKPT